MSLKMSLADAEALQRRLTGEPAKKKRAGRKSKLESSMLLQLKRVGVDGFVPEYKFHSVRDWRFDFAHPDLRLAVECEGYTRNGKGRHQNPEGMTEDARKYNEAAMWGWTVLRFTQPMVKSGEAVEVVQRMAGRLSQRLRDAGIKPP